MESTSPEAFLRVVLIWAILAAPKSDDSHSWAGVAQLQKLSLGISCYDSSYFQSRSPGVGYFNYIHAKDNFRLKE